MAAAWARNGFSLLSAESTAVVSFIRKLNGRFTIPQRHKLKHIQGELATEIEDKIRNALSNSPVKVG
jgi:hypothetical protein